MSAVISLPCCKAYHVLQVFLAKVDELHGALAACTSWLSCLFCVQ